MLHSMHETYTRTREWSTLNLRQAARATVIIAALTLACPVFAQVPEAAL